MPALNLPLLPGSDPSICESAEGLDVFLCPVNAPYMAARIGEEKIHRQDGHILVTQGEKFKTRDGWTQGMRYLRLDTDTQKPVAVLNVSLRGNGRSSQAVASNVYTDPRSRRKGLAAELMQLAKSDFPGLYADNAMSVSGAALVGYVTSTPSRRAGLKS